MYDLWSLRLLTITTKSIPNNSTIWLKLAAAAAVAASKLRVDKKEKENTKKKFGDDSNEVAYNHLPLKQASFFGSSF